MTLVGKILVIIILLFSIGFLTLSTVVYSTSTNWKDKHKVLTETMTKKAADLRDVEATRDRTAKELKAAQDELAARAKQYEQSINAKQKDLDQIQKEITENRTLLETAQKNAKESLDVASARTHEADELLAVVASTQKQANEFKEQQRDLKDRIRILEREVAVAKDVNKGLRERTMKLASVLRDKGIDPNTESTSNAPPPNVEGKVLKVGIRNDTVEFSLGANDGILPGHTLFLYSTNPPAYKGKIEVKAVDPNQSSGKVIGKTVNGQKILEGDNVSSEIRTRG